MQGARDQRGVARQQKAGQRGSESTHWRIGTHGSTRSTTCVAVPCIRRVVQDGQIPRLLQENATSSSSPHAMERTDKPRFVSSSLPTPPPGA